MAQVVSVSRQVVGNRLSKRLQAANRRELGGIVQLWLPPRVFLATRSELQQARLADAGENLAALRVLFGAYREVFPQVGGLVLKLAQEDEPSSHSPTVWMHGSNPALVSVHIAGNTAELARDRAALMEAICRAAGKAWEPDPSFNWRITIGAVHERSAEKRSRIGSTLARVVMECGDEIELAEPVAKLEANGQLTDL